LAQELTEVNTILILSDSIENTQLWIEQVLPYIGSIPAIVVTSAQASAALQPYVDSQQIKGLVAGIEGGNSLGQLLNLKGEAGALWDTFQVGLLLILAFIICGGIIQAIASKPGGHKAKREVSSNAPQ